MQGTRYIDKKVNDISKAQNYSCIISTYVDDTNWHRAKTKTTFFEILANSLYYF